MRPIANSLAAAAACLGIILASSSCFRSRGARRSSDLPAAFTPIEWSQVPASASNASGGASEGCATRLRDDRDGTILLLRRSESRRESKQEGGATVTRYHAVGDYEVLTPGRYGVSVSQWLRVDCVTQRPVGPVARQT